MNTGNVCALPGCLGPAVGAELPAPLMLHLRTGEQAHLVGV